MLSPGGRDWDPATTPPSGQRNSRQSPWLVSSPASRRPGTQRPLTKVPASTVSSPASGGPGVFGEKLMLTPKPATKYSSGPVEMNIAPARVGGSGGGSPRLAARGLINAT